MNLYYISQRENEDYDTYDSAVVAAETEEAARLTHPSPWNKITWDGKAREGFDDWTAAEHVTVRLIGTALPDTAAGVICASFNAG